MFAPTQYPGMQQTGYCQFVPTPFVQTQIPQQIPPFQGEKRNLSPNAVISPTLNIDDKRRRNEDPDNDQNQLIDNEPTMTDLKTAMDAILTRLNTTATKVDVATINDKITAQNCEIEQLKTKMQKHEEEMKKLQTIIDEGVAANLHRKLQTADQTTRMKTSNMADSGRNQSVPFKSTRRNLIIEGLNGVSEDEMCAQLIKICANIDITLYRSEIEAITRFNRRDNKIAKPGPVLVTITRTLLRDTILQKKNGLQLVEEMQGIFINADEPLETRRAKSVLRKVARITKQQGIEIEFKHDRILIEGVWYTTNDINRIPTKYMPLDRDDVGAAGGGQSSKPAISDEERVARLIKPGEKMRVTKAGLCFAGPSAFPSNMHFAPIMVDGKDQDSNEQSFQYDKANEHGCADLAEDIRKMDDPYEIKKESKRITTTTEWEEGAPDKLWGLLEKKYAKYPMLLERLIETAPLPLIEASKDTRWGGGAPFHSNVYDTGKFTGGNEFGNLQTRFRDTKIRERMESKMS